MADETQTLASSLEEAASGLVNLARFLRSWEDRQHPQVLAADGEIRGVLIDKDATLVLDKENPKTDVELPRLRRILKNTANNAEMVRSFLFGIEVPAEGRSEFKRNLATAMRLMVTIRDTSRQSALLLDGEDLDRPLEADETAGMSATMHAKYEQAVEIDPWPGAPAVLGVNWWEAFDVRSRDPEQPSDDKEAVIALALAEVYKRLRELRDGLTATPGGEVSMNPQRLQREINGIMNYISDGA